MYYYRARYYVPEIGRFIQEDPHPGVLNLPRTYTSKYIYVMNNPQRYTDPRGEFFDPVTLAIAGAIIPLSVVFFDKIKIDDPVGATSVHLVCGIWGTLAVGIFAPDKSFLWQTIGCFSIIAFSFVFVVK